MDAHANPSPKPVRKQPAVSGHEQAIADALFWSIGDGAIVTDFEGKISKVNQAALDILGFERDEIMGKWYPGTVVAEDEAGDRVPYIERPIAEVFLSGKPVFRKLQYRRKDGGRVSVALTVSPVLLDGKAIGAIQIFRDITDEVRLSRAKDEFISLASHQLRTPATAVKQYLGMLLDGYAGKPTRQQERFLRTAYESNERQLRIIDDLLRVATADAGNVVLNKEDVKLIPLIQEVIDDQRAAFESSNQRIDFHFDDPQTTVFVDRNAFRMVLENLIENAHKYTYAGKNIEVRVGQDNDEITIAVRDEGTGIDEADFHKLFQKFSRLNNPLSISSGGTGLGLYWVRRIVDLHGGTIAVESKVGEGTTFTVNLVQ